MKIVQITHNDLDGYGASTVVGAFAVVARVIHVARPRDMATTFGAEINRLLEAEVPEMLIITDLGLEQSSVEAIMRFAVMNAERPGREHRLIVLDHHASSIESLTALGFLELPNRDIVHTSACYFTVPGQVQNDSMRPDCDPIVVMIDVTRSATKLAYDHVPLYAGGKRQTQICEQDLPFKTVSPVEALQALVEGIDAVDLWTRERAVFDRAVAINECFWECVANFIPEGHELHERFVSLILLGLAELSVNQTAAAVELDTIRLRHKAVEKLITGARLPETAAQQAMTTRMRIARLIGQSENLFVDVSGPLPTKMAFAMESGIFQRVSDEMLREGRADLVINVFRGGQMSLRSRNGEALDLARSLGGGGHPSAAGASLNVTGLSSLAEAKAMLEMRTKDVLLNASA